ncbi:periplasmic heavy metal sensor [bacterium]|nr:periplasmic heavy metal sensor [bacterium]
MKKTIIVGILTFVVAVSGLVFAQGHGRMKTIQNHPEGQFMGELNEEQQAAFKEKRMKLLEEIQPLQLQIEKMNVELKVLLIADKPNLRSIEKQIDGISVVKNNIRKLTLKNKLAMRELLNDDQKVMFNQHLLRNKRDHQRRGRGERGGRGGRGRMGSRHFPDMPDDEDMNSPK